MYHLCLIFYSFFIQRYGSALNFDSATYERLHQEVVVQPVAADARREEGMLSRLYYRVNATTLLKCHLATLEEVTGASLDMREEARELLRPRKDSPYLEKELRKVAEGLVDGDQRRVGRVLAAMTKVIAEELEVIFLGAAPDLSSCYVWDNFVLDYGAEKVRFVCDPPSPKSRYTILIMSILGLFYI